MIKPWEETCLSRLEQSIGVRMPMVREAWERSLDLLTCIATAVGSEQGFWF